MTESKYKAGDRVRIKSLDWYNENKDKDDVVHCGDTVFDNYMSVFCGSVVTIGWVYPYNRYDIREDMHCRTWTDEMIEGLVEEDKPKFKVGDKIISDVFTTKDDKGWKVIDVERTGYKLMSVDNSGLICDMDFKNEHYYKLVEEETKFGTASNPIEIKSNANCITQNEVDVIEKAKKYWDSIKDAWICPEGYQFKDENGNIINARKIVLEKKQNAYPKTYEECCKKLNIAISDLYILDNMLDTTEIIYRKNLDRLLNSFRKLLICRDAYWKIAGEEMRLGKPWDPDYNEESYEQGSPIKYVIYYTGTYITKEQKCTPSYILAFPTAEMRDAFYENFKEEIEICKELL